MANYIQAENRKTGKIKFFTETGWRNLQKSNIEHPYQVMKPTTATSKNLIPNKAVQVPKEVIDFKNKAESPEINIEVDNLDAKSPAKNKGGK